MLLFGHRGRGFPVDELAATLRRLVLDEDPRMRAVGFASVESAPPAARVLLIPTLVEQLMTSEDELGRLGWLEVLHSTGVAGRDALRTAVSATEMPEARRMWYERVLARWPDEIGD